MAGRLVYEDVFSVFRLFLFISRPTFIKNIQLSFDPLGALVVKDAFDKGKKGALELLSSH